RTPINSRACPGICPASCSRLATVGNRLQCPPVTGYNVTIPNAEAIMSAVITPVMPATAVPVPRPLTAADLALLPEELATGTVKYELDDGRLVIMPPPGDIH